MREIKEVDEEDGNLESLRSYPEDHKPHIDDDTAFEDQNKKKSKPQFNDSRETPPREADIELKIINNEDYTANQDDEQDGFNGETT